MFNIWVIDDDTEISRDFIAYWGRLSTDYPFRFKHFRTAKQALEEFSELPLQGKSMPKIILVDGHLNHDEGTLKHGVAVIIEIVAIAGQHPPMLIGWTADPFAEEEMVAVGASISFGKGKPKEVILYIQEQYRRAA